MLIHKEGEKSCVKNYHLVAISSILFKVFMLILRKRWGRWIYRGDLLSELQGRGRLGVQTREKSRIQPVCIGEVG